MLRRLCLAVGAVLAVSVSVALAETTYWLPTVQKTPTETVYSFDTRLPDFMEPWITRRTSIGGGNEVVKTINGQPYTVIEQYFGWDSNGHGPKDGKIAVTSMKNGVSRNDWIVEPRLAGEAQVVAALDVLAKPSDSSWRFADVLVLRQDGPPVQNLQLVVAVPEGDQIKARMRQIAESTTRGRFFPNEVEMPADLEAMRREMLAWGNLGRRDPTFRKANKYASDFSGDTVVTGPRTTEKLYKNNPEPPYFNDLVLHPKLNEACQFMAEYYAKTSGNAMMPDGRKHDAPGVTYQGADMSTFGARLDHFAPNVPTSGEGLGGGGPADAYPEGWMRSETHYRPWFNIDHDTVSMGLGAARTAKGWYFCKIGGKALPEGVTAPASQPALVAAVQPDTGAGTPTPGMGGFLTPAPAPDAVAPAVVPPAAAPVAALPLPAGTEMVAGTRYPSADGTYYISIQPDRNLVVRRSVDDGFVWALVDRGVDYTRTAGARMTAAGKFEVYDAFGAVIWFIPDQPIPGGVFDLTPAGTPHVRGGAAPESFALPLQAGAQLVPGERYPFGAHYMVFQNDNNIVVYRSSDDGFAWGLNEQPGVDYRMAARAQMVDATTFAVFDAGGAILWQLGPQAGAPAGAAGTAPGLIIGEDGRPVIAQ